MPSFGFIPNWRTKNRAPTKPDAMLRITPQTFRDLDKFIRDAQGNARRTHAAIDLLVRFIGLSIRGFAQERSAGPWAGGRQSNPAFAFKIPVQRITGAYYAGWKVKQISPGAYMVFNDSREGLIIEEGLFKGRRVPRRVLKYSILSTLQMLHSTRVANRFAAGTWGARQNAQGRFQSFASSMTPGPRKGALP